MWFRTSSLRCRKQISASFCLLWVKLKLSLETTWDNDAKYAAWNSPRWGDYALRHGVIRLTEFIIETFLFQTQFQERLTLKIGCHMDLKFYPFDLQVCPIHVESYAYREAQLRLSAVFQQSNWSNLDNLKSAEYPVAQKLFNWNLDRPDTAYIFPGQQSNKGRVH